METLSNILDPIHDQLPPSVWDDPGSDRPRLKSPHRKWIVSKVHQVLKQGGYTNVDDWLSLVLTGSLTTYQYGHESDCDVSLFVDTEVFPEWSRAEMIGLMVSKVDGTTLPGTTFPMQCFVVPPNVKREDLYKPGLRSGYDLQTDDWVEPPDRNRAHDVEREMNMAYVYALEQADKMERLLRYEPDKAVMLWHQIHKKRRRDQLAGKGDFAESNIVYKFLANRGLMPSIAQASGEYIAHHGSRHDNLSIGDHTWQPLSEDGQYHNKPNQWRTPFPSHEEKTRDCIENKNHDEVLEEHTIHEAARPAWLPYVYNVGDLVESYARPGVEGEVRDIVGGQVHVKWNTQSPYQRTVTFEKPEALRKLVNNGPQQQKLFAAQRTVTKFVYDPVSNHLVVGKTGAEEGEHESHWDLIQDEPQDFVAAATFGQIDPTGRVETFGRPKIRGFGPQNMSQYEASYRLKQALEDAVPGARYETFVPPHNKWDNAGPPNVTYMGEPPTFNEPLEPPQAQGVWQF